MDFYIVLGLERAASVGDIKRAYKRLARRYHPDINPGDRLAAAQFRQIAEAYETLIDPDRRRRYDTTGSATPPAEPSPFGFEGFDFSVSVSGSAASTFGDLFADVLDQRETRRHEGAPERGSDLHQTITIAFEEAVRGGQHPLTVTRQEHCRTCRGAGWQQVAETRCLSCQGVGTVKTARGHMVFSRTCAQCGGTGRQRRVALSDLCGPAGRDAHRAAHDERPGGSGRRGPDPGARQRPRRPQRRRERGSLHHRAGRAAPAVSSRGRRSARHDADCGPRGGARREDRRAVARRPGAAARAARHAVGPAVPAARPRRAVAARRRAAAISSSKCGWCCRRCSTSDRRNCCGSSGGSMREDVRKRCLPTTKDTKDTNRGMRFRPWWAFDHHEENRQSVLHDQRGGAEVQHPPADACACTSAKGC